MSGKVYTPVATFPSSSDPNKTYTVSSDENGELSCDCPGWTRRNPPGGRTCKHVEQAKSGGFTPPVAAAHVQSAAREKGGSLEDLFKRIEAEIQ